MGTQQTKPVTANEWYNLGKQIPYLSADVPAVQAQLEQARAAASEPSSPLGGAGKVYGSLAVDKQGNPVVVFGSQKYTKR